jgi:hypothetical protein
MMMLLAAAALATTPPPGHPVAAVVQATATIRIVTAVRLKLDAPANDGAPPSRDSVIRLPDGSIEAARLIEFQ